MNRLIRKRVFLPTGVIALVIMPLFFSWMVVHESRFHPKATLEFNLSPDTSWTWMRRFGYDIQMPRTGEWVDFSLNSSAAHNDAELLRFEQAVRMFVSTRDTLKSIRVALDRGARYSALVQVVDILRQNGDIYWLYLPGEIWIPRHRQLAVVTPSKITAICGGVHVSYISAPQRSWVESLTQSTIESYRFLWSGPNQWSWWVTLSAIVLLATHSIFKQTARR